MSRDRSRTAFGGGSQHLCSPLVAVQQPAFRGSRLQPLLQPQRTGLLFPTRLPQMGEAPAPTSHRTEHPGPPNTNPTCASTWTVSADSRSTSAHSKKSCVSTREHTANRTRKGGGEEPRLLVLFHVRALSQAATRGITPETQFQRQSQKEESLRRELLSNTVPTGFYFPPIMTTAASQNSHGGRYRGYHTPPAEIQGFPSFLPN